MVHVARNENDMSDNSLFGVTDDGNTFVKLRLDSSWIIEMGICPRKLSDEVADDDFDPLMAKFDQDLLL